jgi:hypothetical protein
MTERRWWEIKDPNSVLSQVIRMSEATAGDVVVARVDIDTQQVTGTRTLDVPPAPRRSPDRLKDERRRGRHRMRLSALVRDVATELALQHDWQPDGRPGYTGVFVTVVCREGHVVDTEAEWRWLSAWRYSNHFRDGWDGDVYVVTPHGWTGVMDRRADLEPALRVQQLTMV